MKFSTLFGGFLWAVTILFAIVAIFEIVPNIEIAIGFIAISFGILAIIWTSIARVNLSKGSSLRDYVTSFLFGLIFIFLFSIWHTFEIILSWKGLIVIPKYMFITIAYLIFSFSAYKIWLIGKEFGFRTEAKKINNIIKERKEMLSSKKRGAK